MKVRYLREALTDLRDIEDYLRAHDPGAARRIIDRIENTIRRLETFPWSARRGAVPGTRILIVPGTPYYVVLRPTDVTMDVVAVFHVARGAPR